MAPHVIFIDAMPEDYVIKLFTILSKVDDKFDLHKTYTTKRLLFQKQNSYVTSSCLKCKFFHDNLAIHQDLEDMLLIQQLVCNKQMTVRTSTCPQRGKKMVTIAGVLLTLAGDIFAMQKSDVMVYLQLKIIYTVCYKKRVSVHFSYRYYSIDVFF